MTTIVAFIFALGVLITFHELGHYLVARLCGVKVLRFCLGFGKPFFLRRLGKDQTEWAIAAIPLGGYVKMLDEREGEVHPSELSRAFNRQSVYKRIAIVAAGPIANLLLAIILYFVLFVSGVPAIKPYIAEPAQKTQAAVAGLKNGDLIRSINNEEISSWQDVHWALINNGLKGGEIDIEVQHVSGDTSHHVIDLADFQIPEGDADVASPMGLQPYNPVIAPQIDRVLEGSVAEAAGLRKNDLILAINNEKIQTWEKFVNVVQSSPDKQLQLLVQRQGKELEVSIRPTAAKEGDKVVGKVGIAPIIDQAELARLQTTVSYPVGKAITNAVSKTWEMSIFSLKMIGKMLIGEVSWKNLSGPITIADYAGQSVQLGLLPYITFLALISINLGVLNLLPIPLLDGGHLMYYIAELLKGSPVSERAMEIGSRIGFALLFVMMVFAFYNDINRHFIS